MKLIEGMKKLRLLEKKIQQAHQRIGTYASAVSTEKLPYETEEGQRDKVSSLVQSSRDMVYEYLNLKSAIDGTNLETVVTIEGMTLPIHQWIWIRRKMGQEVLNTLSAMNENSGRTRLREATTMENSRPQVLRFYDEEAKLVEIDKWQNIINSIDPRLEVVNAVTDIIGMEGGEEETI